MLQSLFYLTIYTYNENELIYALFSVPYLNILLINLHIQ